MSAMQLKICDICKKVLRYNKTTEDDYVSLALIVNGSTGIKKYKEHIYFKKEGYNKFVWSIDLCPECAKLIGYEEVEKLDYSQKETHKKVIDFETLIKFLDRIARSEE